MPVRIQGSRVWMYSEAVHNANTAKSTIDGPESHERGHESDGNWTPVKGKKSHGQQVREREDTVAENLDRVSYDLSLTVTPRGHGDDWYEIRTWVFAIDENGEKVKLLELYADKNIPDPQTDTEDLRVV